MSAKYGYIGNNPSDTSVVVAKQVFAPTGVQTTFTFVSGYSIGYLDVYINGARQVEGQDYNATDTSTVGLSSAAQGGDIIELVAYKAFNVATVDTIPGDLRVQGKLTVVGLTTGSNAFYSGIVTATSFSGSGANLTGISSVSFATTSFGLSGTPNLNVGVATVTQLGINTTTIPTKLYVQGNAASNIVTLTDGATITPDFTLGNNFQVTIAASRTIANPTGVTTGQSGVIFIQEDGTGGYTVGWGTSWDFASSTAPTLITTASALNALPYFARSTTSIVVGSVISGIGTL